MSRCSEEYVFEARLTEIKIGRAAPVVGDGSTSGGWSRKHQWWVTEAPVVGHGSTASGGSWKHQWWWVMEAPVVMGQGSTSGGGSGKHQLLWSV